MTERETPRHKYRTVLRLLDNQRRYLADVKADEELVLILGAIVRHLSTLSERQIAQILESSKAPQSPGVRLAKLADEMVDLPLSKVLEMLRDEKTPRFMIEAIAVGRFRVPKGSLRSTGNLQQLRDKVLAMAQNERTHETIVEVTRDKSP